MSSESSPSPPVLPEIVQAEGRLVEVVVSGATLVGTAEELAGKLSVHPTVLGEALGELADAGWIFVAFEQDGRLRVGWERRVPERQTSVLIERRRSA